MNPRTAQKALETDSVDRHVDENDSTGREFVEADVIFTRYVDEQHDKIK